VRGSIDPSIFQFSCEEKYMPPTLEAVQTGTPVKRSSWTKANTIATTAVKTLLWFFAIAVLAQDVVLQKQNKNLKEGQATMVPKDTYLRAIAPPIDLARKLPNVAGVTLHGDFREIQFTKERATGAVIITFSPGCIHCMRNQDGWAALASGLRSNGWPVIWVSRDPLGVTQRYCKLHGMDSYDVLADPTYATYTRLGLASVPNTVVVDTGGAVQRVWAGELTQKSWQDLFAYFHLSAPPSLLVGKQGVK
jgi:hypothetical protein